jgi:hypothetical protein
MKYKKCCFAREKSKKRLARMNHSNNDDHDHDDDDEKEKEVSDGEEEKKEEFIGDFKVLNI